MLMILNRLNIVLFMLGVYLSLSIAIDQFDINLIFREISVIPSSRMWFSGDSFSSNKRRNLCNSNFVKSMCESISRAEYKQINEFIKFEKFYFPSEISATV